MSSKRLLLLEDNVQLAKLTRHHLRKGDYVVDIAHSIGDFHSMAANAEYGLYIVDLGLPDGDALELISEIRGNNNKVPIIIVSARSSVIDRISGLKGGADDYLVKPFHVDELIARIEALLRRPQELEPERLRAGRLELESSSGQIYCNGELLGISPQERRMLALLISRHDRLVSKVAIEQLIYDLDNPTTPNAIDKLASRLRKRIGKGFNVSLKTVHGDGYVLETID